MDTGSHDSLIPDTEPASKGTDDPKATRETLAAHRTPTALIVDTVAHRSAAIKAWAWQHRGVRPMFATTSTAAYETATREQPDVAILDLMFRNGRGSIVAVELRRLAPRSRSCSSSRIPRCPRCKRHGTSGGSGWCRPQGSRSGSTED